MSAGLASSGLADAVIILGGDPLTFRANTEIPGRPGRRHEPFFLYVGFADATVGLGQRRNGRRDNRKLIRAQFLDRQKRLDFQVISTSPIPRCTNVVVEPRAAVSSTGTFL